MLTTQSSTSTKPDARFLPSQPRLSAARLWPSIVSLSTKRSSRARRFRNGGGWLALLRLEMGEEPVRDVFNRTMNHHFCYILKKKVIYHFSIAPSRRKNEFVIERKSWRHRCSRLSLRQSHVSRFNSVISLLRNSGLSKDDVIRAKSNSFLTSCTGHLQRLWIFSERKQQPKLQRSPLKTSHLAKVLDVKEIYIWSYMSETLEIRWNSPHCTSEDMCKLRSW